MAKKKSSKTPPTRVRGSINKVLMDEMKHRGLSPISSHAKGLEKPTKKSVNSKSGKRKKK